MRSRLLHSIRVSRLELTVLVLLAALLCAFTSVAFLAKSKPVYTTLEVSAIRHVSNTVGISDSDLFLVAQDPAKVAQHLDAVKALGVTDLRIVVPWGVTEPADGVYAWTAIDNMVNAAKARGMKVQAVVTTSPAWSRPSTWFGDYYAPPANPSDYGDFMSTLAKRYSGAITSYEVWNEPNAASAFSPVANAASPGAAYTQLLKAGYNAIKAADPKATVVGGVVGSVITFGNYTLNPVQFVQQMYAAGAAGYFDALSFHPYQNTTQFSQGATLPNSPLNQLTDLRNLMVANGDAAKSIWATEYGLPTGIVTEAQQATYIKDFLDAWTKLSYTGPSFIYTTVDRNSADKNDPESTFGLYRDNWTLKPAGQILKDWIAAHPVTPPVVTPPTTTPTDAATALGNALAAALQQFFAALAKALAAAFNPPAATATTQVAATTQVSTQSVAASSRIAVTGTIAPAAAAAVAATPTTTAPAASSAVTSSTTASSTAPSSTAPSNTGTASPTTSTPQVVATPEVTVPTAPTAPTTAPATSSAPPAQEPSAPTAATSAPVTTGEPAAGSSSTGAGTSSATTGTTGSSTSGTGSSTSTSSGKVLSSTGS